MFNAKNIPFEGLDKLDTQDPNQFLRRETVNVPSITGDTKKNITYIEYLLSGENADLVRLQLTLSHYVSLIKPDDQTHLLALEKFTRCICLYILQNHSLESIANIQAQLERYFPFYIGHSEKRDWLKTYHEKNNMSAMLQDIFKRISYRVRVGQCARASASLMNLPVESIKKNILSMAEDSFYTTHQTKAFQAVNTISAQTGWLMSHVPGLSYVNATANKIAQAIDYPLEIPTERQKTLRRYVKRVDMIASEGITFLPQKEKEAHVELLMIFYAGGNPSLQEDIATKMNGIIIGEQANPELLTCILTNIAPEPLGLQWIALHAKPDILNKLSFQANKILLGAAVSFCNNAERVKHQEVMGSINTEHVQLFPVNLRLSENATAGTEWLAYLLCMGNLPKVSEVRITCGTLNRRQTMLMLYLMGSSKLVIASDDPVNIAKLSTLAAFTPQCCYEITGNDISKTAALVTKHSLAYRRLSTRIRLKNPSLEILQDIMTNTECFNRLLPCAFVQYSLSWTDHVLNKSIEFELSATSIKPCTSTTLLPRSKAKLVDYILDIFSQDWGKALEVRDKNHCIKVRPIAIPGKALSKESVKNAIANHDQLQLFVYAESEGEKVFLYDIYCAPIKGNKSVIKPGPFITTQKEFEHAKTDFPEIQIDKALNETILFSRAASEAVDLSSLMNKKRID
ncbi:MAG: hypothetical protein ACHQAX_09370 [Gammaproteobacteria bacterium]